MVYQSQPLVNNCQFGGVFFLLLRQSISDHYLRSCGYVICSRPQRTATGGLEPGTSWPKVLGLTTGPVRYTFHPKIVRDEGKPGNVSASTFFPSPASQPSKLKDHTQWIVLTSGTSTLTKSQVVGQIWLTPIFSDKTTFSVMQMVYNNKKKRHTLDNRLQKLLNFD